MPSFYQNMQNTASGLLKRFGMTVTIRRTIPGAYNPGTGESEAPSVKEWTPSVVKSAITEEMLSGTTTGGSRIMVGDMQLLVDCQRQPFTPEKGDKVLFPNGETWTIMQDMPVEPAGVVVLYQGIIRRG